MYIHPTPEQKEAAKKAEKEAKEKVEKDKNGWK